MITGKMFDIKNAIYAWQLDGKGSAIQITDDSIAAQDNPFWFHVNYDDEHNRQWLEKTPLIPDLIRKSLCGESSRPRVTRIGDSALIILRSINTDKANHAEEPLVIVRVYISKLLIISSRRRIISAIDDINNELAEQRGPASTGEWLVELADNLTDYASEYIDNLHGELIKLEDKVLNQVIPKQGKITRLRKKLIILRRYLLPQRDVFSRLAINHYSWMTNDNCIYMQAISDRLNRAVDDLDACLARTAVLSDEIHMIMSEAANRRTYTMSLLAMLFLPLSFFTGLFGVNLNGIPAAESPWSFLVFCLVLLLFVIVVLVGLKRNRWL